MALIRKISPADALLAAAFLDQRGQRSFLKEFIDYGNIQGVNAQASFIHDFVNNGLENLPREDEAAILKWVQRLPKRENLPAQQQEQKEIINRGRRNLILKGMATGSLLGLTTKKVTEGDKLGAFEDWGILAAGSASLMHAEKKATQCEELFRRRVVIWMKGQHDTDFSFPGTGKEPRGRG